MGTDLNRKLTLLIVSMAALAIMVGCAPSTTPTPTPTASPTPTQSPQNQQPIEVISVLDTYKTGQTVIPAGPEVEITLKNVGVEPVISLAATLDEKRPFNWDFYFDVTPSNPLLPGKSISAKRILIGGGFGDSIPYSLTINGTLQNGATFAYTWEPPNK